MDEADVTAFSVIAVSLHADDLTALDGWIDAQSSAVSRSDAIRTLMQQTLSCFNPNTTTIRSEFG